MSGPTHRDQDTEQIEFCELCGMPVGAADRVRGTAQGLHGVWVCPLHAELATSPSWLDLGGTGSAPNIQDDTEPHSGIDPYEAARNS